MFKYVVNEWFNRNMRVGLINECILWLILSKALALIVRSGNLQKREYPDAIY